MASSEYWEKRIQSKEFQDHLKEKRQREEERKQKEKNIVAELHKYGIMRAEYKPFQKPIENQKVFLEKRRQELFLIEKGSKVVDKNREELQKSIKRLEKRIEIMEYGENRDIRSHYGSRPME